MLKCFRKESLLTHSLALVIVTWALPDLKGEEMLQLYVPNSSIETLERVRMLESSSRMLLRCVHV